MLTGIYLLDSMWQWGFMHKTEVNGMEKSECVSDYEKRNLVMTDDKCNNCQYLYECRFMVAEMEDVTFGGF